MAVGNYWFRPNGAEFAVNTDLASLVINFSDGVNLARLSNGNWIAVWDDTTGADSVQGQIFDASGYPVGDRIEISTPVTIAGTDFPQWSPTVTETAEGGFYVVWTLEEYNGGYNTGRNVLGRAFDSAGTPLGDSQVVANQTYADGTPARSTWEAYPALDTLADGRIAVTYYDDLDISVKVLSSDGATTLASDRVNTESTTHWQRDPSIAALADGGFVVSWSDDNEDEGTHGVYAQIYDADAEKVGSNFRVNSDSTGSQNSSVAVGLAGGGFVIAFYDSWAEDSEAHSDHVSVRIYDADGVPLGADIHVDPSLPGGQGGGAQTSIEALPDGGFVVLRDRLVDYYDLRNEIYGTRFDAAGNQIGDSFLVNSYQPDTQRYPRIVALEDGKIATVWYHTGTEDQANGLYGQIFDVAQIGGEPTEEDDVIIFDDGGNDVDMLAGDDQALGGAEDDTFEGSEGNDRLGGAGGNDELRGDAGNDTLEGGDGNDVLYGGSGDDEMSGGAGADEFVIETRSGADRIMDFDRTEDRLSFDGVDTGEVTATDIGDNRVFSLPGGAQITMVGAAGNSAPTAGPEISGTARQGETLTADISGVTDADGFDPQDAEYQWLREGEAIDGATSASYTLGQPDVGAAISVRLSYLDGFYTEEVVRSAETDDVENVNDAPEGALLVSGMLAVDEVLMADATGISDADGIVEGTQAFVWLRDGEVIDGATGSGYTLTTQDEGAEISARFSYEDGFGATEAVTSAATAPIPTADMTLTGTPGPDVLIGGAGDDMVRGLAGDDRLDGLGGDDNLDGGDGVDTIVGGSGDDVIVGGSSQTDLRDVIYGGDGDDLIDGGYGNDELRGDAGNDTIAGGFGADTVLGGGGDDVLTGSALGDMLFGADGDDFVNGGFGYDRVNGGAGADDFYHLGIFDHGSDWIQDYDAAEGDVLVFGNAGATRAQFQINVATTPTAGAGDVDEAFVIYRPTGQIMWALVDGDGQDEINLRIGATTYDLTEAI